MATLLIPGAGIVEAVGALLIPNAGWLDNPAGFTFDESLQPNAVTLTNLTGAYTDIDDDPDAPDGSWLTAT